jgi:hypothetical protein
MHILAGVGHLSPLEAPAEVARIIASFLSAIEEKSARCNAQPSSRLHSTQQ